MKHRILLVDDDTQNYTSTKRFLETRGYQVDYVDSGPKAIKLFQNKDDEKDYALVLMDYFMAEMDGTQAAKEILSIKPNQQIAMYSCDDAKEIVKEALRVGFVDYIEKDISSEDLAKHIDRLCAKYEQTTKPITCYAAVPDQNAAILNSSGFIGASNAMVKVVHAIENYAKQKQTVLISGETGTGKEKVAKALHQKSDRASGPFVAINCGSIPENLLESTLFGHEKGAFTGAVKTQTGKFILANHGTLFLDEIGDLPMPLQVKLLRVLQEQVVEPVGSTRVVKVDVRIVAATHMDLKRLVKEGKFREDLYYRLNVLSIHLPALRERPEDIEPLVAHFTAKLQNSAGIKKYFERQTLPVLSAYSWPGNIRELENLVERQLIDCPGPTVKVEHLDPKLFKVEVTDTLQGLEERQSSELKRFIEGHLKRYPTKSEAAKRMGISPSRLHYYLMNFNMLN